MTNWGGQRPSNRSPGSDHPKKIDFQKKSEEIQDTFGDALYLTQHGAKHRQAKSLEDFGSKAALEEA
jgi:hypothetical protein